MRGVTKNYNYRYKDHSKLTPSEEITYKLMQKGLSNKQIAAELNLNRRRAQSSPFRGRSSEPNGTED
jgi:DNA-binding NarL/FixJ family response regulator